MDRETRLRVALDMVKEVVDRDVEIPLKTFGFSMRPFIYGGEWVVVRRAQAEDIRVGDILIYQAGNTFVAHRAIRRRCRRGHTFYTMKGDAHLGAEGEIAAEDVVAKVVAIKRNGQAIDLSRARWRWTSRLLAFHSSLVDRLYRSLPFLHGSLRTRGERPAGRFALCLVGWLLRLPGRFLVKPRRSAWMRRGPTAGVDASSAEVQKGNRNI